MLAELEPCGDAHPVLPDFEDAIEKFYGLREEQRRRALDDLRAIVDQHRLNEVVAIHLKHKHFEMLAGHVLLERQSPDARESVMAPAPAEEPMIPFSFVLAGDGGWRPYEFVEAKCTTALAGLIQVRESPNFTTELADALIKHGLQDVLGFHILHRRHLGRGAHGQVETPGHCPGELLLRPYTEDLRSELRRGRGKTYQVMWSWSQTCERGGFCIHCDHCSHCGAHCNSHSTRGAAPCVHDSLVPSP